MLIISVIITVLISQEAVSSLIYDHKYYYDHFEYPYIHRRPRESESVSDEESMSSGIYYINFLSLIPEGSENASSEGSISSEGSEYASSEESRNSGEVIYRNKCTDPDQSLVTDNDIRYTIENFASKLELEANLQSSLLPEAEEVRDHYLSELKEYYQHLVDRPAHLIHIMEDIANTRHRLEPTMNDLVDKIYESDVNIQKYNDYSEQADTLLKKVEKSKKICQINCDHDDIDIRFGYDVHFFPNFEHFHKKNISCITLKDLHDYVNNRLSQFGEDFDRELYGNIEGKKEIYDEKLEYIKINLKDAAVKQFGMTMYDILSLQDNYYHFEKELGEINMSSQLTSLEENTAQIKLMLIVLKNGVENYRHYCLNCNSKQRNRRDLHDDTELRYDYNYDDGDYHEHSDKSHPEPSNIIDVLMKEKIDEILENYQNKFDNIFKELDEAFDDPDVIEEYVSNLEPVQQDIENRIEEETRLMHELQSRVEASEIHRIHSLLEQSKQLLNKLENTQHFINRFL
ncbi:unnamed protein product [Chrysodeixis includens]|uniref:Uncharacterized protein n=1 Tax=Chrysodeixis includens TaxID=689277 RepID=A0A9P0FQ47_CHRIL|nr:unnamed protein product [Chrysodeixis includens]